MIIYFLLFFPIQIFSADVLEKNQIEKSKNNQEIFDIIKFVPKEIIDKIFQCCDEKTGKSLKFASKGFFEIAQNRFSLPYWKRKDSILLKENMYPVAVKKTFSTDFQIKYFLIDYYKQYQGFKNDEESNYNTSFDIFLRDNIFSSNDVQICIKNQGVLSCSNERCSALFVMVNACEIGKMTDGDMPENIYVIGKKEMINNFLKTFQSAAKIKNLHIFYEHKNSEDRHDLDENITRFKNLNQLYLGCYSWLPKRCAAGGGFICIDPLFLTSLEKLKILSAPCGQLKKCDSLLEIHPINQLWVGNTSNFKFSFFPNLKTFIFSFSENRHYRVNNIDFSAAPKNLSFVKILLHHFDFEYDNEFDKITKALEQKEEIKIELSINARFSRKRKISIPKKFDLIFDNLIFDNNLLECFFTVNKKEKIELKRKSLSIRYQNWDIMEAAFAACEPQEMKSLTITCDNNETVCAKIEPHIGKIFFYFPLLDEIKIETELENNIRTIDKKQLQAIKKAKERRHHFCYMHVATLGLFGFLLLTPCFVAIKKQLKSRFSQFSNW